MTLNETLLLSLLDKQPNTVTYFVPVFDAQQQVVDFEVAYCNEQFSVEVAVPVHQLVGQKILSILTADNKTRRVVFQQLKDAYAKNVIVDDTLYNQQLDKFFHIQRRRVDDGVLSVGRNVTGELQQRLEKEYHTQLSDLMLNSALDAWFICDAVLDEKKDVADFIITRINPNFTQLLHLSEEQVINKSYLSLFPSSREQSVFELNCRVFKTGMRERKQVHYHGDGLNAWYDISTSKLGEKSIIINFSDITHYKKTVDDAENKDALLNGILKNSANGIAYGSIMRNEKGEIVDGRSILANDAAFTLTGIPRELFLGKKSTELEPNIRESEYFRKVIHTMETGEPSTVEYFVETSGKWIEISLSRVDDEHMIIVFSDRTEQKRIAADVEQKTILLQNILTHSANGILVNEVIRNSNGDVVDSKCILANDAAAKFMDLSKEEMYSHTSAEIEPHLLETEYFKMCLSTLKTGEPFFTQYKMESTGRWLQNAVSKMDDEHLITIFTDITPTKEAQLQQEKMVAELKRSNESLEEFTRASSHDLKEPIRKVHFFINRLKTNLEEKLDEEEARLFSRMEKATERMKLLVDDLLEYSQIRSRPAEMDSVDLNQKLKVIISDLELAIQEKSAILIIGDLPTVKGYRRQLQQLFQNLITNALKYTQPSVPPVIEITSRVVEREEIDNAFSAGLTAEKYNLIEVKDNGIGFEQIDAERIFHLFTRLHGNTEFTGTGIGLSIVKKVVENHNGFVYASSEQGKGAAFYILLPVE